MSGNSISIYPGHIETHSFSLTHTHFKKSRQRCQECVCWTFDIGSDAIFGAMGRAESWTWHSRTLMLAWLLFLSWHGSGHLGRELVQLLLIPLLSTSGLQNNFTPYLGWVFLPQAFYHQWGTVHLSFPQTQTSSECFSNFQNSVLMYTWNCCISYVFTHEKFAQAGFIVPWLRLLSSLPFPPK